MLRDIFVIKWINKKYDVVVSVDGIASPSTPSATLGTSALGIAMTLIKKENIMGVVTVNDQNFQSEVLEYKDAPVLVDFAALWCGPCKMIEPVIEDLSSEYAGKMKFGKLDIDENRETAAKFSVMSIPTLIIFKNGQVVKQMLGAHSKESFKKEIDSVLNKE